MNSHTERRTPKISVIMPVYNGEKYLHTVIKSILDQTFGEFEFLIMNDGSTDRTAQILEAYGKKDRRIKVFQQKNSGIVNSMNMLIFHAKTDLIARIDADDIAYPKRLELQYEYMKTHPETVLLGTTCIVFRDNIAKRGITDSFSEDFLNRWFLTFNCAFTHSTVMYRKKAFAASGGYWPSEYPAEDYGLWIRMKKFGTIENLKNILGEYRLNVQSISGNNFRKQIKVRNRLNAVNFEDIYRDKEIPDLQKVTDALQNYIIDRHRRQVFGKLACLTGCFLIQKGEIKRAVPYFKWSFAINKKRLDALLNLILSHFHTAVYVSIDIYVRLRTITPQIRWFKTPHDTKLHR